jgi:hypothetical protein
MTVYAVSWLVAGLPFDWRTERAARPASATMEVGAWGTNCLGPISE